MSKIKVLVIPSDRTGVGKFRSVDPHIFLQKLYPDDFHVDIIYDAPMTDMDFWKKYQVYIIAGVAVTGLALLLLSRKKKSKHSVAKLKAQANLVFQSSDKSTTLTSQGFLSYI